MSDMFGILIRATLSARPGCFRRTGRHEDIDARQFFNVMPMSPLV